MNLNLWISFPFPIKGILTTKTIPIPPLHQPPFRDSLGSEYLWIQNPRLQRTVAAPRNCNELWFFPPWPGGGGARPRGDIRLGGPGEGVVPCFHLGNGLAPLLPGHESAQREKTAVWDWSPSEVTFWTWCIKGVRPYLALLEVGLSQAVLQMWTASVAAYGGLLLELLTNRRWRNLFPCTTSSGSDHG